MQLIEIDTRLVYNIIKIINIRNQVQNTSASKGVCLHHITIQVSVNNHLHHHYDHQHFHTLTQIKII